MNIVLVCNRQQVPLGVTVSFERETIGHGRMKAGRWQEDIAATSKSRVLFATFWIYIHITAAAVNNRGGVIWASISKFQQAWNRDWRYVARLWRDGVITILSTLNPHYPTFQYHGQLIPQRTRI